MKGIILAGGSGTRLYPITKGISKQLMPIYDKPMIYYPLSSLIAGGINEILIITTPNDSAAFKNLLGDGSQLGCKFVYEIQQKPEGLAQAFQIGAKFLDGDSVCMMLGDNLFYGDGFDNAFKNAKDSIEANGGGVIFAYHVNDPERYGVVEFDLVNEEKVLSIEEKPLKPKSDYASPGIYFYDKNVVEYVKEAKVSERGELEITEIHNSYLRRETLFVQKIGKGNAWLDTGTFESMMQAGLFIQVVEQRQNIKVGCIEEAAYKRGFISKDQLLQIATPLLKSGYGKYLLQVAEEKID